MVVSSVPWLCASKIPKPMSTLRVVTVTFKIRQVSPIRLVTIVVFNGTKALTMSVRTKLITN